MAVGHPQFYRQNDDPLWRAVPEDLKQQINQHVDSLVEIDLGQPCIWLDLDTLLCKHYEYRPQMCRDFELGNPHCHRLRESYGIPKLT